MEKDISMEQCKERTIVVDFLLYKWFTRNLVIFPKHEGFREKKLRYYVIARKFEYNNSLCATIFLGCTFIPHRSYYIKKTCLQSSYSSTRPVYEVLLWDLLLTIFLDNQNKSTGISKLFIYKNFSQQLFEWLEKALGSLCNISVFVKTCLS